MTGSVVCGVDDSESAKGAARVACRLSAQLGSRLVFVCGLDGGSSEGETGAVAARLHHLAESATEVDCGADWLVDVGHPADRLLAVAEKEAASLIVVGSTGPRSSLLGSISAEVSRRAPCPVVVVAPGADVSLTNGNGAARISGRNAFAVLSTTATLPVSTRRDRVARTETDQGTTSTRAISPAASSASAPTGGGGRPPVPREALTRYGNAPGVDGRAVRGSSPTVGERRSRGAVATG